VDVVPGIGGTDARRIAAYVAGYILKKIGREKCLPGLEPEFQTMSKRRAIGVDYIVSMARTMKRQNLKPEGYDGVAIESSLQMIRIDGKLYPLARTLRDKIKESFPGKPSELQSALRQQLRSWKQDIIEDTEEYEKYDKEIRHKAKKILEKYMYSRLG
jgi:hypothetical protein